MDFTFRKAAPTESTIAFALLKQASETLAQKQIRQWDYWQNPPEDKIQWVQEGFDRGQFYFIENSSIWYCGYRNYGCNLPKQRSAHPFLKRRYWLSTGCHKAQVPFHTRRRRPAMPTLVPPVLLPKIPTPILTHGRPATAINTPALIRLTLPAALPKTITCLLKALPYRPACPIAYRLNTW